MRIIYNLPDIPLTLMADNCLDTYLNAHEVKGRITVTLEEKDTEWQAVVYQAHFKDLGIFTWPKVIAKTMLTHVEKEKA